MFFSIYINSMLYDGNPNINFMYVVSPPQEGLPYLNENQGWFMYIIKYAILILLCVSLIYIKPIICSIKSKFSKKVAVSSITNTAENTDTSNTKEQKKNDL